MDECFQNESKYEAGSLSSRGLTTSTHVNYLNVAIYLLASLWLSL